MIATSTLEKLNTLIVPKPPAFKTQKGGTSSSNASTTNAAAALHKLYAVLNEKARKKDSRVS